MFCTRIVAEAKAQGLAFKVVRDTARLSEEPGTRLIVDLNQPGALEAAVQWKKTLGGTVIGFVSHVDSETIAKAREARIDQVVARGQFVAMLPQLLAGNKSD